MADAAGTATRRTIRSAGSANGEAARRARAAPQPAPPAGRRRRARPGRQRLPRRWPATRASSRQACRRCAPGARARPAAGSSPARPQLHADLEAALAGYVGAEAALVFSSGYPANLGALTALAGPGGLDRLRRAQPRLADRRLPAGSRAARGGRHAARAIRTRSARPSRLAGRTARRARRDRLGVQRRRRPRPAGGAGRRRAATPAPRCS